MNKTLRLLALVMLLPLLACSDSSMDLPLKAFTTPHGVPVTLFASDVQDAVAIALAFDCGTACDDPAAPAAGQLAPTMFLQGAGGQSAAEIFESLKDFGGDFSLQANSDQTYVAVSAPSKGIEGAVKLANLVMRQADFPEKALVRKRETIALQLEEAAAYPEARLQKAFFAASLGQHPYVQNLMPDSSQIRAVQRADLLAWREQHLATKNIVVSIVGNIDQNQAGALVDSLLDGLPQTNTLKAVPAAQFRPAPDAPLFIIGDKSDQATVMVGATFPREPALADWMAGMMLSNIFSGDEKSRLFKDIREASGATYGLQPNVNFYEALELNLVGGRVSKAAVQPTLAIIAKSWAKFRTDGPTQAEVENAKANQLNMLMQLARSHTQAAGTLRDYGTGHWTTAQLAQLPSVIKSLNLNDPIVLKRYFPEKPIVVVAQ